MWQSNEFLLKRWANLTPIKSWSGTDVPVVVGWEWGELVLMTKQCDGGAYYVYRRESVQGKFAVVKLWGLEVLCTSQTLKGALRVCKELNAIHSACRGLSGRVDEWLKCDAEVAENGWGRNDDMWDDARDAMESSVVKAKEVLA